MKEHIVYDGWLKVYKREVDERNYDILKNYDAAAAFILNDDNEVLMVRQYRPALMTETMEIPAGVLDKEEESMEQCAAREIEEETGMHIDASKLRKILQYKPMMGFSSSTMYVFLGKVEKDKVFLSSKPVDEDVTEAFWMPLSELKEHIEQGRIFDGKTLMAFYYYISSMK